MILFGVLAMFVGLAFYDGMVSAMMPAKSNDITLGLQIAQSRSHFHTLGPK